MEMSLKEKAKEYLRRAMRVHVIQQGNRIILRVGKGSLLHGVQEGEHCANFTWPGYQRTARSLTNILNRRERKRMVLLQQRDLVC